MSGKITIHIAGAKSTGKTTWANWIGHLVKSLAGPKSGLVVTIIDDGKPLQPCSQKSLRPLGTDHLDRITIVTTEHDCHLTEMEDVTAAHGVCDGSWIESIDVRKREKRAAAEIERLAADIRCQRDRIDYLERSLRGQVEETGRAEAECRRLHGANTALVEALEDISSTPDARNEIGRDYSAIADEIIGHMRDVASAALAKAQEGGEG